MLSLALALLSLASAHSPFRLNTQGEGQYAGLNITLGSNSALTTSNGSSLIFWIEEEAGEEFGTYFINTGSLLTTANKTIVADAETGFEPGSFNITSAGLLSLANSTTGFWVCPSSNGDIAYSESSPCSGGVNVEILAIAEDEDAAVEEYYAMVAAENATESATSAAASGTTAVDATGTHATTHATSHATSDSESASVSASASGSGRASSGSAAASGSGASASGTAAAGSSSAAASNAAVALVPAALMAAFSLFI